MHPIKNTRIFLALSLFILRCIDEKIIFSLLSSQFLFACGVSSDSPDKSEVIVQPPNIDEQIHNEIPTVEYQSTSVIKWINFNHHQTITYIKDMFITDFDTDWAWIGKSQENLDDVAKIMDVNGDMKLAITSLKDDVKVGIHSGKDLTEADDLYFLYELTFNGDYDFAKGGKLPGLGSLNLLDANVVKPTRCRV